MKGNRLQATASVLALALALAGGKTYADETLKGDLIVDGRLRYEFVEQDGLKDAKALTARLRLGWEQQLPWNFAALIEGEGVGQINRDFGDTVRVRPGQTIVTDPEAFEINRLQLQWSGINGLYATLGRQRVILGNARFVGNVGFRQNEQTFDAARVVYKIAEPLTVQYFYIDRVRRIFGDDSPMGEWRSDSHVAQIDLKTGFGGFSGYALLLDFDNAAGQSNETYGLRWTHAIAAKPYKFHLGAEYAAQSDYGKNPAAFDLDYYGANIGVQRGAWRATLNGEILEGNGARGFATPLATLHAFQGFADVFLATPAAGIRDLNGTLSWTGEKLPYGKSLMLLARYHNFASDDGDTSFGHEIDLIANWKIDPHLTLEAKAAVFSGDTAPYTDRTKIWIAAEFSY